MIDRLEGIARRYHEIEAEMARPEVASDHAQLTKLAREQRTLREMVSAYEEYKRALHEAENGLHPLRVFEVDAHARTSAIEYLSNHRNIVMGNGRGKAIDPENIRAHVGQHHGGKGPRADARDLNDLYALEWAMTFRHKDIQIR